MRNLISRFVDSNDRAVRKLQPIVNEAKPDVRNDRGTLAMARTGEVNSATSQFFINLASNDFLNQTDKTSMTTCLLSR